MYISDIILDLSYPLSASDSQSNWPGVTPFQKTTVDQEQSLVFKVQPNFANV